MSARTSRTGSRTTRPAIRCADCISATHRSRYCEAVDGLDLVELPGADECCGFGGTFAIKNAETSSAILDSKLANVLATGAEVVTAVDRSCLMQIGGGLSRWGARSALLTSQRSLRRPHEGGLPTARARLRSEIRSSGAISPSQRRRSAASAPLSPARPDWEELRAAGAAIKRRVLRHLDYYLLQFESSVQRAGGTCPLGA